MIAQNRERWAVQEYARCLVKLHRLIARDADEGDEGDALRDEMDIYWYEMSPAEIEFVGQISEQLYGLNDEQPRSEQLDQALAATLTHLIDQRRWQRVLTTISKNEARMPLGVASFFRGLAYRGLGLPAMAAECFACANRLHPGEPQIQVCLLSALLADQRDQEALSLVLDWNEQSQDVSLLLKSAEVMFVCAVQLVEADAFPLLKSCVSVSERALSLVPAANTELGDQLIHGWLVLSLCLSRLGNSEQAAIACRSALNLDPAKLESLAVWGYLNDDAIDFKNNRLQAISEEFRSSDISLKLVNRAYPFQLRP